MKAIVTHNLDKTYGSGVRAVRDLSLQIEKGTIFGFLGPNGSGKTTTVRLLNGTLLPTGGSAEILGLPPGAEAVRLRTSTLAELARMYDHLSVIDNLRFFGRLYGLGRSAADGKIEALLPTLELREKGTEKLGSLSTGMQKRVSLARVLLSDPEVAFLDEPTSGLDPESSLQVTGLIRTLARERGTTVFLCTHNLAQAERICDAFGFLHEGRLVAAGTRQELVRGVEEATRVRVTTIEGTHEQVIQREEDINGIVRAIMEAGERIREVRVLAPDLEALYFHYLGRAAR
jgi:ABC-2 type transport system ATP-binding protein